MTPLVATEAERDIQTMRSIIKRFDEYMADTTAQAFGTPFKAWEAAKYPVEHMAARALQQTAEPVAPSGYAYRYPDGYIRFSDGQEINGRRPKEAIPYYFGAAPARAPSTDSAADALDTNLARQIVERNLGDRFRVNGIEYKIVRVDEEPKPHERRRFER